MAKPAQSRAKVAYAILQLYWKQGLPGICRQAMLTAARRQTRWIYLLRRRSIHRLAHGLYLEYLRLRNVGENYFDLFLNLSKIRLPYQALKCGAGANGLIG